MPRLQTAIARQFGAPRGPLGRLVGRFMARNNRSFNRWVLEDLEKTIGSGAQRIVELGCGPGVGLGEALRRFPQAELWGIDPSGEMVAQAGRRNAAPLSGGRLHVLQGDTTALAELAPLDLVYAVHVLYFWHEPNVQLTAIRDALRPSGTLALGYRLRRDMPRPSQVSFPAEGHRLYETDDEVLGLLRDAGFAEAELRLPQQGDSRGRLAIGTA
jgi:SAM-dependent methyltransferase